ncbi:MAG: ribosome small subunit-dependent GTPase A, partial [Gemmatimonadaceae bacterium]|nr:ribosome small subunit-dependent GTPase A [Gemmatimonadaceae bacterium]
KLTVGDRVRLERDAREASWSIGEILPRVSQLARREPGGRQGERILAANIDQVVIVFAAANPEPHLRMLDRFLVIAEANDLRARVVVNKADLVAGGPAAVETRFAEYARIGYPLHTTATPRGGRPHGLDTLREALDGRTSVVTGPSGVGKSSLLNALYPGLQLRTGDVSAAVNKGRHTTVGAFLHPLPDGGYVVDTPGLREVGTWGIDATQLGDCFPEVRAHAFACRFADCAHRAEPDCAVRGVLGTDISAERYDSYCRLRDELEAEAVRYR